VDCYVQNGGGAGLCVAGNRGIWHSMTESARDWMTACTRAKEDEFGIEENGVGHKPTDAAVSQRVSHHHL
jgi:hypothetical protein